MKKLFTLLLFSFFASAYLYGQTADFGDAPDNQKWWGGVTNFPTLNSSTGPKHTSGDQSTFWIGDVNSQGANPTTMETDAKIINADEDNGKPHLFLMMNGIPAPAILTVPITTAAAHNPNLDIYVNVTIDVDNDLDFDDNVVQNWVIQNKIIHCPADTTLGFSFGPFKFGTDLVVLPAWIRITVTTEPIVAPWDGSGILGGWVEGETEDWCFGSDRARGYNGRKGLLPVPETIPVDSIPPLNPQPEPNLAAAVELIQPPVVYLECNVEKCLKLGIKNIGNLTISNVVMSFSQVDGLTPKIEPHVVGLPQIVGNISWYNVCATGWDCLIAPVRWANYKVTVSYYANGKFNVKDFMLGFGNNEYPVGIDANSVQHNWVAAEPVDSSVSAPWFMSQASSITKKIITWSGQYPDLSPWLATGEATLAVIEKPAWSSFSETTRSGNSATYTFSGTPTTADHGLERLVLEVSSSQGSDGFDPWEWTIPIYIDNVDKTPVISPEFVDKNINVFQNQSIALTIKATDDDFALGKRDTLLYDWYLWDKDSLRFHDVPSATFSIKRDSASLLWTPTRDDVGNYRLVGQAWDYYLNMDTTKSEVKVLYMEPDFEAKHTVGFTPSTLTFTDKSTIENTNVTVREWNFDDGKYSSVQNPVHTYNNSGTYTPHLTLKNGIHTVESIKYQYIILNKVDFDVDTTVGLAPFTVQFNNLSGTEIPTSITSNTATSASFTWVWDFGDSLTNSEYSPSHIYTKPGVYNVSMKGIIYLYDTRVSLTEPTATITSNKLTKNSLIRVTGDLLADFEARGTEGYAPLSVTFTDKSTGPPESWLWTFGDGTPDGTVQNPVHVYTQPGVYNVSLQVRKGELINQNVQTELVKARQALVAAFTAEPTSGDAPLSVAFTNESLGDPAPIAWYWDFGDGATSLEQSPVHLYNSPGTYDVTLVIDNDDVMDTLTKNNYIVVGGEEQLNAEFNGTPRSGMNPLTVHFTDLSTGNPNGWLWNFGPESATSTLAEPYYTYENSGTYTVSLTVTDGVTADTEEKADYIIVGVTGINDYMQYGFELHVNYPNPLKQSTNIGYTLKYGTSISLRVYNILGEEVRTFVNSEYKEPGSYNILWNGTDANGKALPPGVYYYELKIEGSEYRFSKTKELIIVR